MDLGRRAGQAARDQVGADVVQVPLLDQQAPLASAASARALDFGLRAARPRRRASRVSTSPASSARRRARLNRITRRAAGGRGLLAVSITVTSTGSSASTISQPLPTLRRMRDRRRRRCRQLLQVGDLRDAQLLGTLRADLGRVAVDRLATAEDEVVVGRPS